MPGPIQNIEFDACIHCLRSRCTFLRRKVSDSIPCNLVIYVISLVILVTIASRFAWMLKMTAVQLHSSAGDHFFLGILLSFAWLTVWFGFNCRCPKDSKARPSIGFPPHSTLPELWFLWFSATVSQCKSLKQQTPYHMKNTYTISLQKYPRTTLDSTKGSAVGEIA